MEATKIVYTSFGRASSGLDVQALPSGMTPEHALTLARYRLSQDTIKAVIYLDDGTTISESWHPSVKIKPASKTRAIAKAPKPVTNASAQADTATPAPDAAKPIEANVTPAKPKVKAQTEVIFYYTGGGTTKAYYDTKATAISEAKHTLKSTQAYIRAVVCGKSITRVSLLTLASSYDPKQAEVESYWNRVRQENAKV